MKLVLSEKMIEVLVGRVEDLEEGRESAAVSEVAMVVVMREEEKGNCDVYEIRNKLGF